MYCLAASGADRRGPRAFETAREALCHLYDLQDATASGIVVTDADGRVLSEVQLMTLSIAEGLEAPPDAVAAR